MQKESPLTWNKYNMYTFFHTFGQRCQSVLGNNNNKREPNEKKVR